MKECSGLFGSIFGHKFEPRYEKSASILHLDSFRTSSAAAAIDFAEKYRDVTYVGDVCVRCGEHADNEIDGD